MGEYINIAYLKEISDNDKNFLSAIAAELKVHIDRLVSELPQAAENEQYEDIKHYTHKFRSILMYLGNPTLANRLKEIELKAIEKSPEVKEKVDSFCEELVLLREEVERELN